MDMRASTGTDVGGRAVDVSFSDNCKYFCIATEDGFQIRATESSDISLSYAIAIGASTATMMGHSQIVGVTNSQPNPNKLSVVDSVLRTLVGSVTIDYPIIRTVLTLHHICIISRNHVHLYTHSPSAITHLGTYDTTSNNMGICTCGEETCVFPARSAGQIQILRFDKSSGEQSGCQVSSHKIIPAHASPLKALCLTRDGEIVCSASITGTIVRLHSASSGAKLGELRRGVGAATIYSLAASPSGGQLALTSDTNTLHIFNLPTSHLQKSQQSSKSTAKAGAEQDWHSVERSPSPMPAAPGSNEGSYLNWQKWGSFAKIPFAPRIFTDVYSFVSTGFDPGKDDDDTASSSVGARQSSSSIKSTTKDDAPKAERVKGLVGWIDDETLVVLSAGRDARYERFKLHLDDNGAATLQRNGWARYMKPN